MLTARFRSIIDSWSFLIIFCSYYSQFFSFFFVFLIYLVSFASFSSYWDLLERSRSSCRSDLSSASVVSDLRTRSALDMFEILDLMLFNRRYLSDSFVWRRTWSAILILDSIRVSRMDLTPDCNDILVWLALNLIISKFFFCSRSTDNNSDLRIFFYLRASIFFMAWKRLIFSRCMYFLSYSLRRLTLDRS